MTVKVPNSYEIFNVYMRNSEGSLNLSNEPWMSTLQEQRKYMYFLFVSGTTQQNNGRPCWYILFSYLLHLAYFQEVRLLYLPKNVSVYSDF